MLIVVDAANVVGSVPDGWWRDRVGATERLRDVLAAAGPAALPGADADAEIVLVVEGAARRVQPVPGIRVIAAERSADDAIVEICQQRRKGKTVVVTADRGLRDRVSELGARVVGPSTLQISRASGPLALRLRPPAPKRQPPRFAPGRRRQPPLGG